MSRPQPFAPQLLSDGPPGRPLLHEAGASQPGCIGGIINHSSRLQAVQDLGGHAGVHLLAPEQVRQGRPRGGAAVKAA